MKPLHHGWPLLLAMALSTANAESEPPKEKHVIAPASQPSRDSAGTRTQCNEWEKDSAREGECEVETEATTWKVRYWKEGVVRKSMKDATKNLLVLFPPDGSTHKIHEWWDSMVGPGRAIDTNKWLVLCLDFPVGETSKIALSLFMTTGELIRVEKAVLDALVPKRKPFVMGGPSRGGQFSILFSLTHPKELRALLLVAVQTIDISFDLEDTKKAIAELDRDETTFGPYENWNPAQRQKWWETRLSTEVLTLQYTEEYFRDPKWMVDVNMTPQQYQGADHFKKETLRTWVSYLQEGAHPRPLFQKILALNETTAKIGDHDYEKLPDDIFCLSNKRDLIDPPATVAAFTQRLRTSKKNVESVAIEDVRGHTACCVPAMPEATSQALAAWLGKR